MFFYEINIPNLSFKLHEFCDNDASIRFMSDNNTLLSIDLSISNNIIVINQNIDGKYLVTPPTFKTNVEELTSISISYHSLKKKLSILFSHKFKQFLNMEKKLLVKNFNYDKVVVIGLKTSLDNFLSSDITDNKDYEDFLGDCIRLESFKKIENVLKKPSIKLKLAKSLLESSDNLKNQEINNIKGISYNMDKILDMETSNFKSKLIKDSNDSNDNYNNLLNNLDSISIFPENKNSHKVILYRNGKLGHGNNSGKWITKGNRLLLFLDGSSICLYHKNGLINDLEGVKWYSEIDKNNCGDINIISQFLENYSVYEKWIILVITCYKRLEQAKQIRDSWLNDFRKMGFLCLFVIGDQTKVNETGIEFINQGILYVNCSDSYEALPAKIACAVNYCYKNFSFNYLYKIDDDSVVNPLKLLSLDLQGKDYIGKPQQVTREFNRFWHKNKCQNQMLNKIPYPTQRIILGRVYAKGEAGYFLSRRAVECLIAHIDYLKSDLYEDKAVGEILYKMGINLFNIMEYQTKLNENFGKNRSLDRYTVIMDVGKNITNIYKNNINEKIK